MRIQSVRRDGLRRRFAYDRTLIGALVVVAAGGVQFASADVPGVPDVVNAPALKVGDSWVFELTTEKGPTGWSERRIDSAVERVDDNSMLVGIKPDEGPGNPEERVVGLDWSMFQNFNGTQTTTAKPFSFPLSIGKSWTVDYTDPDVHGNVRSAHYHTIYKVVGWEDVEAPAGKFHALKIEGNGTWTAEFVTVAAVSSSAVATSSTAGVLVHRQQAAVTTGYGSIYRAYYYVPALRRYVKTVEETFDKNNVRALRTTQTLYSYKLATP